MNGNGCTLLHSNRFRFFWRRHRNVTLFRSRASSERTTNAAEMQNECCVKACCAAALLHLMYFWQRLCPSCVRLLGVGRQVKGARRQNAWCVAYFPGSDLPWTHRCEENEDELEHRGCPLVDEREDQLMDLSVCLVFSFLFACSSTVFVPFRFSVHPSLSH